MNTWGWYLMDKTIQDVLADTEEGIRSWLCEVLIVRGDIDEAKEEGNRDRRVGLRPALAYQQSSVNNSLIGEMLN